MSISRNFGVLRIVRVDPTTVNTLLEGQKKSRHAWVTEERLVHLIARRETMIGRALSSDLVLMDPTVSRDHARLVLDEQGWCIYNLTENNAVCVNGCAVPASGSLPVHSQDFLLLGHTTLQLIAPQQMGATTQVREVSLPSLEKTSIDDVVPIHERLTQEQSGSMAVHLSSAQNVQAADSVLSTLESSGSLPHMWDEADEGKLLGEAVTMQLTLAHFVKARVGWLIFGISVAILAITAVIAVILHSIVRISILTQDGFPSLLAALTIPLIPAIGISLLVKFVDRFEREPWFLRLSAFLWGAIIAVPLVLFIENNLDGWMATIFGPNTNAATLAIFQGLRTGITEETAKGLGLLFLFVILRDEFDNMTDGIVYGALIGAGFAMVENFFYFSENPKQLLFLIVGRIVLGWLSHSTFTACFGMALGYIRHTRVRWRQIVIPLLGYLAAVGLHSAFDFINTFANDLVINAPGNPNIVMVSLIAVVINYIPSFLAQLVILYFLIRALAHEVVIIREFLVAEVSNGIVSVDEYVLLHRSFARGREERRVLKWYGMKQWLRVRALYQTEIGLAFCKWHMSMGDKPKSGYLQPEDAYRHRIRRLRQAILATETKKV